MTVIKIAPAVDLERYRDYLRLFAQMQIDPRLRRDQDASDIVQTVMLRAYDGLADFHGSTQEELASWIARFWRARFPTYYAIVCEVSVMSAGK